MTRLPAPVSTARGLAGPLARHGVPWWAPCRPRAASQPSDGFWFARFCYFLGLLTVGQLTIRPAFGVTLSDLLFLASLLFALPALMLGRRYASVRLPRTMIFAVSVFTLAGLASSLGAHDPWGSVLTIVKVLYLTTVWFWLGTTLLRAPIHVAIASLCWASSAALDGVGAVCQLVWGDVIPDTAIAWGRMTGFTQHVNDLGGICSLALLPALAIALERDARPGWRLTGLTALCLGLVGLVLSGSVGGMAAAAASFFIWFVLAKPDARQAAGLCGLLVVIAVAAYLQSEWAGLSPLTRLIQVTGSATEETSTGWTRLRVYQESWSVIRTSPLLGVGLDSSSSTALVGDFVHNMFLGVWLQTGFLGFLGFCAMVYGVSAVGVRSARSGWLRGDKLPTATLCAQIGAVVLAFTSPILLQRYAWVPASLILATRAIQTSSGPEGAVGLRPPRFWRRAATAAAAPISQLPNGRTRQR